MCDKIMDKTEEQMDVPINSGLHLSGIKPNNIQAIGSNSQSYPVGTSLEGVNGRVNVTFSDGSIYKGFCVNGKLSGFGIFYYPNGDHYQGKWANNKREGNGQYTFKSGYSYDGLWNNDQYMDSNTASSSRFFGIKEPEMDGTKSVEELFLVQNIPNYEKHIYSDIHFTQIYLSTYKEKAVAVKVIIMKQKKIIFARQ